MDYTTPVYFGISLSLLFFLSNCGNYFIAKKHQLSVIKSEMLFALGLHFFKAEKNGVEFKLGWLPLGSYVKHSETDEENLIIKLRKTHKSNVLFNLIIFVLLVFLIDFSFNSFTQVFGFYKSCVELAFGNLTYDEFIQPFSGQTTTPGYFIYIFSILSLLPIAATIISLLETTFLKYPSLLFGLAVFALYIILMYKIAVHSSVQSLGIFYISCLVSAFVFTLISMLIIKKD